MTCSTQSHNTTCLLWAEKHASFAAKDVSVCPTTVGDALHHPKKYCGLLLFEFKAQIEYFMDRSG
jgi:hypothetical protein